MSEVDDNALDNQDTLDGGAVDEDLEGSFLKGDDKDMQRMSSALGRSLKQQGDLLKANDSLNEKIDNLMEIISQSKQAPSQPNGNLDLATLNENWQTRILQGDVIGVLDEFSTMKSQADIQISQANTNKVDQLVAGLEKDPLFKQIGGHIKEHAMSLVKSGKDPETAVQLAYQKDRGDYLSGIFATVHSTNPDTLKMAMGGGKPDVKDTKKGKLPPKFKEAAKRDIAAGIFKDEAEYIANMSPVNREQFGL